jgi:hypothetical protein
MTSNITTFYSDPNPLEILRITKEGIWANPDIPVDEAAKKVLEAIDHNIKVLVQKAVEEEREACAKVCDDWPNGRDDVYSIGVAIRARGQK